MASGEQAAGTALRRQQALVLPDGYYLVPAAAVVVGLRPGTLRRYTSRGLIAARYRIGHQLVYHRSELERFRAVPRLVGNPNFRRRANA
jgi:hypothetical protein